MSDTGPAIYVANLFQSVNIGTGWGAKYQPSNPLLDLAAMMNSATKGASSLDGVQTNMAPFRLATGSCEDLFALLSPTVRRSVRIMKASGIPASTIEDAQTYTRKVLGVRATKKPVDDPATPVDESKQSVSASQMSRTSRIENFDAYIAVLDGQPLYAPNENDLKLKALKGFSSALQDAVNLIGTTFVPFSNSLNDRDAALYINADAVVPVGKLFKAYVEAAFGRNSNEWNQVKALQFNDDRRIN